MAKFTLEINTDNAAFEYDVAGEVARVLRHAADKVEEYGLTGVTAYSLRDFNGNRVGSYEYEGEDGYDDEY